MGTQWLSGCQDGAPGQGPSTSGLQAGPCGSAWTQKWEGPGGSRACPRTGLSPHPQGLGTARGIRARVEPLGVCLRERGVGAVSGLYVPPLDARTQPTQQGKEKGLCWRPRSLAPAQVRTCMGNDCANHPSPGAAQTHTNSPRAGQTQTTCPPCSREGLSSGFRVPLAHLASPWLPQLPGLLNSSPCLLA